MTHASVFSGIGGPEVAATMLGWENLFHCEINPFGRAVLDYWYPNAKSYEDITKTDFSEWRGKVDVLTGGFPYQPFSYAGLRRGAEDDRYLWPYMFKCIDAIRPTWVVAENVGGILTMVEQGEVSGVETQRALFGEEDVVRRYELRETFTLERICRDLETHGYAVQPVLVPACAVGAPHRRDRVFIVGRRRDDGDAADTAGKRGNEIHEHLEPEQPNGAEPFGDGWERNAADTNPYAAADTRATRHDSDAKCIGRIEREYDNGLVDGSQQAECREEQSCGADSPFNRWRQFPTVSPVHRGNDGLPFPLDDLTISASKWRTESLKAYGNAIVPQVMYEIFRAIEIAEKNK